mgnify:FL=1
MKAKNHNVYLTIQNKNRKLNLITIGIIYLFGSTRKGQISTKITLPEKAWDKGRKFIKETYWEKYKPEYDRLTEIQYKIREVRNELSTGKIHWDRAKYIILDKPVLDDTSVLEYTQNLEPKKGIGYSTIKKYNNFMNALHNKLVERFNIKELTFAHLEDVGFCEQIEDYINDLGVTSSTKRQYLTILQKVWKIKNGYDNKRNKEKKIFYNIPAESSNPTPKKPLESKDFTLALNDINTLQQFEALLMWLYSLSLMGLDGIDIVNIDEGSIVTKGYKDIDFYHPESTTLNKKLHIEVIRSKEKLKDDKDYIRITRVANLFPTLLIKRLLEHCIKHNHPTLSYKGNDKLKLFNFYTRDKNRNQIQEGYDKWETLRKYYNSIMKKKLGATLQYTRSTTAQLGYDIGVDISLIDANLGHSNDTSRSIKHYLSEDQIKLDTYHIFTMQEFKIMKKLRQIYTTFKDKYQLLNSKEIPFIPKDLMPVDIELKTLKDYTETKDGYLITNEKKIDSNRAKINYLNQPLSRWDITDEMRYQRLIKDNAVGKEYYDEDLRKWSFKPVAKEDYSDELKELIKKKADLSIQYASKSAIENINKGKGTRVVMNEGGVEVIN